MRADESGGEAERFKALLALKVKRANECGQILESENAPQPTVSKETGTSVLQLSRI